MKIFITLFLIIFSNLSLGQVARIVKDSSNEGIIFFSEAYKVEFCQTIGRNGFCLGSIEAMSLSQDQKFVLVQKAVSRFFDIQELTYKGYMDSIPLYLYIQWSEDKRDIFESLMIYDFNNQRRFLIGRSSYQACAGCDDNTVYFEIIYNVSKNSLNMNTKFYPGRG